MSKGEKHLPAPRPSFIPRQRLHFMVTVAPHCDFVHSMLTFTAPVEHIRIINVIFHPHSRIGNIKWNNQSDSHTHFHVLSQKSMSLIELID